MMDIHSVSFVKSSAHPRECPPMDKPEYAFIGRSNVGKSSLINMIVGRQSMAKISSTPGKTQLINHFEINAPKKGEKDDGSWYITDLPGFGYAKVSRPIFAGVTLATSTVVESIPLLALLPTSRPVLLRMTLVGHLLTTVPMSIS